MHGHHLLIVGGSSGIGLAVAAEALRRGAAVSIAARNADRLEAAAKAHPGLRPIVADAADPASLGALVEQLAPVDHLYHAAGAFVGGGIADGTLADFRPALEARLWGAVTLVRALLPRLSRQGSVTLTGGVSSDRPVPGAWATSVATAAAEQLARALALELAPIRVNAVAPGWTDTPMWDAVLGDTKLAAFAEQAARLPVGHIAAADDVAAAVLFLMTNRSVTGEVVHVDGGARLV